MTALRDPASFDAFYRAENRRVLRYFGKRVGWEAAPDLMQEAFTRVFHRRVFERLDSPQAYLTRTAHNLLIERARRRMREQNVFYPLDEERDAPVRPEQTWQIEFADLRRVYRRTLLNMPQRTRRIFLMHRLQGVTYREIAERFGISEQGVEYHMMRALAGCRNTIEM